MIIWIDDSINAGKTTVAKRLASRFPKALHIEIDDLRHFADCLTLDEVIPFCVEDAASLTSTWIEQSFNVVLSWPVDPRRLP